MKPRRSDQRSHALARIEVLVIVVAASVLLYLALAWLLQAKRQAGSICCDCNLKQIGIAFRIWEGDQTNHLYPMSVSTNFGGTFEYVERGDVFRHFQVMSNELSTPKIVVCPTDVRRPAKDFGPTLGNSNISYFVGVDAVEPEPPTYLTAQMVLSGDRNLVGGTKLVDGVVEITTNQSVRWSSEMHDGTGNVLLTDGSVATVTDSGLTKLLQQTGVATNRLAIP